MTQSHIYETDSRGSRPSNAATSVKQHGVVTLTSGVDEARLISSLDKIRETNKTLYTELTNATKDALDRLADIATGTSDNTQRIVDNLTQFSDLLRTLPTVADLGHAELKIAAKAEEILACLVEAHGEHTIHHTNTIDAIKTSHDHINQCLGNFVSILTDVVNAVRLESQHTRDVVLASHESSVHGIDKAFGAVVNAINKQSAAIKLAAMINTTAIAAAFGAAYFIFR